MYLEVYGIWILSNRVNIFFQIFLVVDHVSVFHFIIYNVETGEFYVLSEMACDYDDRPMYMDKSIPLLLYNLLEKHIERGEVKIEYW